MKTKKNYTVFYYNDTQYRVELEDRTVKNMWRREGNLRSWKKIKLNDQSKDAEEALAIWRGFGQHYKNG